MILTVPPSLRHHLHHPSQLAAWTKRAWEAIETWARAAWGVSSLGAAIWWHPTGEDDRTWHPHINAIVPLVDVDTGKRLKAHVAEHRLGQLRAAWATALSDLTGSRPNDVNVFYEYRSGAAKKRHALRYFGRSFPAWAGWTAKTRWMGALSGRTWSITRHRLEHAGHFDGASARLQAVCRVCSADMHLLVVGDRCHWGTGPPQGEVSHGRQAHGS